MQVAIDSHKKGKASGSNGIRAEDMKACDETTKVMIRQTFNEPHRHGDEFRIIVIHKGSDVEEAGNYRPNCTLPAL